MRASHMLKAAPLALALALAGCHDSDDDDNSSTSGDTATTTVLTYEVSVTNLTAAQPLSPISIMLHGSDFRVWSAGSTASEALETLAEAGDSSALVALDGVLVSSNGDAPLAPGSTETLEIAIDETTGLNMSVVTMLVNTNDAFTGSTGISLDAMAVGDTNSWSLVAYDAGTEANSEMASTIPGPAGGGAGFDATRDDVNYVHIHPGVVSAAEGLTGSALSYSHKFDNPVIRLSVTRTQ